MRPLTLTGPAAGVLLLAGLFENNIETSKDDAAITSWPASHGDSSWMAHAAVSVVSAVLLLLYVQVLRSRLSGAAGGTLERSVSALGTMVATMIVVGAALFAAVPVGRLFEDAPDPSASVYRYLLSAAASVMVIFVSLPAAALCGCVSALGLSRGTMPRWLGYTGVALAVLMLASAFVAPLMVFGLWLVVSGIGLSVGSPARVPETALVEPATW
jgi:hypothetical protein